MHQPQRPSRIAMVGILAVGAAIAFSSFSAVRAQRFILPDKVGTFTCKTGLGCVDATSSGKAAGVYGTSTDGNGIFGRSAATGRSGISGVELGNGDGVYALSKDTSGKYAALFAQGSESATNIFYGENTSTKASCSMDPSANLICSGTLRGNGTVTGVGVSGSASVSGIGVYGDGGIGVYGDGGIGVQAASAITALSAEVLSTSGYALFAGGGGSNSGFCTINWFGDESCSGTIMGGQDMRTRHRTSTGRHVLAYAAQSTSATIEDFGTAQMIGGVSSVHLDPTFASTIDHNRAYYVFLTPLGDTRGLYVSDKTASGFQVRETEHGHSTLGFDYRIVAHPLDSKNDRLSAAPQISRPVPAPRKPLPASAASQDH